MCRVAWDQSYDNFWDGGNQLLLLESHYEYKEKTDERGGLTSIRNFPALGPEIVQNIQFVKSATRFRFRTFDYFIDEQKISFETSIVDSSFFDVLQIKIIEGNPAAEIFKNPGNIIISKKTATTFFPDGNALGQQILCTEQMIDGSICDVEALYTVGAICEDIPLNSAFSDIQLIMCGDIPYAFDWGSSWITLLRTVKNPDIKELNQEINTLLEPRYKDNTHFNMSFNVYPLRDYHKREVKENDTVMSLLAFVLLLIAGLNFALLSLSSLPSRAKEVGVRKTAGARSFGIFSLIIWETTICVLMATALSAVLLWGFKAEVEALAGNYENIFAFENLWAAGLVLITIIIISGVIPAFILSRISVTQIFKRFTSHRLYWKRILLFIQFTASIFVLCLMLITLRQYKTSILHSYGFEHEKLIWTGIIDLTETQRLALLNELTSDSRVEGVTLTNEIIWEGFSGWGASLEKNGTMLNVRGLIADSSFFRIYRIPILMGTNFSGAFSGNPEVIVNMEFLQLINSIEDPIGKTFFFDTELVTIVGVCKDFESIENGVQPLVIIVAKPEDLHWLAIKVNNSSKDVLEDIRKKIEPYFQNEEMPEVSFCSDSIIEAYSDIYKSREVIGIASIFLLFITVMGVLGYVNMETKRRSKEIAIRKIHGSTAAGIIWMVSRELLLMAILAASIAIPLGYMTGIHWQSDFRIKAALSWDIFVLGALVIILTIFICTMLQTWRTANSNPSKSIKSE
jgi:putative ABC transport system permease protein